MPNIILKSDIVPIIMPTLKASIISTYIKYIFFYGNVGIFEQIKLNNDINKIITDKANLNSFITQSDIDNFKIFSTTYINGILQ